MYLALFLTPWVLMYMASTFVMNHRDWFRGRPAPPPKFELERELTYNGEFPQGAEAKQIAQQILAGLEMDGAFGVQKRGDGTLLINRQDLVSPRRITYTPPDKKLTVERVVFENGAFLERFHRRRGFQQDNAIDDTWAFTVDLFIAAVMFWALSGLWMWWEMKVTRKLGALCLLAGIGLFALFLVVL